MKFHCKSLIAVALAVTPAAAQPNVSQHPRIGQLAELKFPTNATNLPIGTERELGEIAAWTKENPEGTIIVEGHADREGSPSHNLALSTRRAEGVVQQLLLLGVPREQIVLAGYGESSAGRRVLVWSTRAGYDVIEARLRSRGAHTIQTSNLMARN